MNKFDSVLAGFFEEMEKVGMIGSIIGFTAAGEGLNMVKQKLGKKPLSPTATAKTNALAGETGRKANIGQMPK